MFIWLESTPIALWVSLSLYAYPMLLSLHIVGLAIVVGIFSMRDLRLLGFFPELQVTSFVPLGRLAAAGFTLNAISGLLLFSSQASIFITSIPFLMKISCITVGMVLGVKIQSRLNREFAGVGAVADSHDSMKLMACTSLLVWMCAIIAGRLIAYF